MTQQSALTLRQLRALAAIARHGSMTAAGRALGLTTPAIHSQIRMLEVDIGSPLLHRHSDGTGSALTAAGLVLLDAAERVQATLSQAITRIDAISKGRSGRVDLGVVSTAKYFAPRLVKLLRTLHPDVDVVLYVGNRAEVLRDIDRMRFDLIIMGRPPRNPDLIAEPIGPHPHGIVAAPDHPLVGKFALSAADLLSETFIAREMGSGTRILMTRYLDRLGDGVPFAQVEMGSNETIKQAVMAGLGIAFLSLHTVSDEIQSGSLVSLAAPQLPIERHWFLVRGAGEARLPAATVLAETILRLNGSFLPKFSPLQR